MALGLTLDRRTPYTLDRERELPAGEVATSWEIGPVPARLMARICDARIAGDGGTASLLCLLGGLHGCSSYFDAEGRPIKHEKGTNGDAVSIEFLDRIPQDDRYELARAIYDLSEIPPEKKATPPSRMGGSDGRGV